MILVLKYSALPLLTNLTCSSGFIQDFLDLYRDHQCRLNGVGLHVDDAPFIA